MTPDRERWAEALAIQRRFGELAPVHIARRIAALAVAGDAAGIARWRDISAKLRELTRSQSLN